ncbi:MAG: hypothetical protein OIF55_09505 [Amphritea sp.]|nr:hypothetical protein [Amphritea sp.]
MNKVPGHFELYQEASSLRAELQAELIMNAFAFVKRSVKNKAPVTGPLTKRAQYKLCMQETESNCFNPLLSKS